MPSATSTPKRAAQGGILIVGEGLAGLTLALALAHRQIKSTVVEKQEGIAPSKWAILVYPIGMKIFRDLGVLDEIRNLAMPLGDPRVETAGGEVLADLQTGLLSPDLNFCMGVGPSEIRQVLRKHAVSLGVEVLEGAKYVGLEKDAAGRVTGAHVLLGNVESTIESNLLVGADGYKSRVREDFATPVVSTRYAAGVGIFLHGNHGLDRFHMVLDDGCVVVLLPLTPELLEVGYYTRGVTEEQWVEGGQQAALQRVASAVPRFSNAILNSNAKFADGSILVINPEEIWAKTLTVDGGVLVGDAAHSFHPGVGQGAPQAFLDASALAPIIEQNVKVNNFRKEAFSQYERERLALVRFWKGNSRRVINTETAGGRYGYWWKKRYFRKAGELLKEQWMQEVTWGYRPPTQGELLRAALSVLF
jgi:2-polyprenyl-6-methoxyphenol hydroxylase-like FAD-dependent oxidoreductase